MENYSIAEAPSMTGKTSIVTYDQLERVLIVGWNTESVSLYDRLLTTPSIGYNVAGFIRPNGFTEGTYYKNAPVVGDLSDLAQKVERLNISKLLIHLGPSEKNALREIISICFKNNISYKIVSDASNDGVDHMVRHVIADVIKRRDFSLRKIIDSALALFLMILFAPLFLVISIAIKLESDGPIFYSQERYGRDRKVFRVIKFRSMVQDAEQKSGPVWAVKRDPRITPLGAFMRKTRIDELPQLLNILKGEMSFIGPRPERPFFADEFKKQIPFYMNRLKVLPGITGLAQVTVGYDETIEDVRNKVLADLEYIDKASSWIMNFKIMFMTAGSVLRGEGQ